MLQILPQPREGVPQIDLGYVLWSWSGSFGYSKPGGLGQALVMVPSVENFCHAPEAIGTAELSTSPRK